MSGPGRKYDTGKPDVPVDIIYDSVADAPLSPRVDVRRDDHLPPRAAMALSRVMAHGARKYGDRNYLDVSDVRRRYWRALKRHLRSWALGERRDPETGESHLAHAAACVMILLEVD